MKFHHKKRYVWSFFDALHKTIFYKKLEKKNKNEDSHEQKSIKILPRGYSRDNKIKIKFKKRKE
jgi:hypothetical protein